MSGEAYPIDPAPPARPRLSLKERLRRKVRENMLPIVLCGLVFSFLCVYLADRIFIFVDSGQAGVLFHTLTTGTELDHVYGEGMHVIWPWNKMYLYTMRVQERDEVVDALSSNGLTIKVSVSLRYYPEYKQLPLLHQKVGPDYPTKIVVPEVVTGVREVIGKYSPEDLYTLKTSDISDAIIFSVARRVSDKFIVLDKVNVTNIRLPDLVTSAIEKKLTQEQVSQEYEFRIASQQQEAKRMAYEAEGIANYNNTINASLTPDLLAYKGIDATLELAKSTNAKVIVVGSGKNGLPLILNTDSAITLPAPAPTPAPSSRPPAGANPSVHH
ncbi:MAG TPA: prohibitin family protein [Opitutaceae bacterium]|nr:prohibitin family protein [Opitutaceae bacterium]